MPVVLRWMRGESFKDVIDGTGLFEGSVIRGMRSETHTHTHTAPPSLPVCLMLCRSVRRLAAVPSITRRLEELLRQLAAASKAIGAPHTHTQSH